MNQDHIELVKEFYKDLIEDVRDKVTLVLSEDLVKVTIGSQYHLPNTPLYLVLESHVVGRESEDDYGLCLTISYQNYDPTSDQFKVSKNDLYITADLSSAEGEIIDSVFFEAPNIQSKETMLRLGEIQSSVAEFLENKAEMIIKHLKQDYLNLA